MDRDRATKVHWRTTGSRGWSGSIIASLRSRLNGGVQRLDLGLMIGGAGRGLALRNHVGVQVMLGSELGQGLVADQGLQGDFGLEL